MYRTSGTEVQQLFGHLSGPNCESSGRIFSTVFGSFLLSVHIFKLARYSITLKELKKRKFKHTMLFCSIILLKKYLIFGWFTMIFQWKFMRIYFDKSSPLSTTEWSPKRFYQTKIVKTCKLDVNPVRGFYILKSVFATRWFVTDADVS